MKAGKTESPSRQELADWVRDARERTFELVSDLTDEQLVTPNIPIINPFLWEVGHVAWFQERWVLREAKGRKPLVAGVDELFDSTAVAHDTRWDLPLPPKEEIFDYMRRVRDEVLELLERREPRAKERYFIQLAVFHEDMHTEAFTYTRQTLGYPAPPLSQALPDEPAGPAGAAAGDVDGDVEIPGGRFLLGADRSEPFVHDNEKWAHPVALEPFAISRLPVTQGEFLGFVEDRGYARRKVWSEEGWEWRQREAAEGPLYWRRSEDGRWWRRCFDRWLPLEPRLPMIHVNWHEAQAYCAWAGRRLPTEAEWECAAAGEPTRTGRLRDRKRRFPWGDERPDPTRANLDWRAMGCTPVDSQTAGASAFGCHHLIGNVWEWTADTFLPYPGFEPDPYKDYSQPWFGTHKVLRGGAWPTRSRLLRNTWRNYYLPLRRDVWAGFRTCASGG